MFWARYTLHRNAADLHQKLNIYVDTQPLLLYVFFFKFLVRIKLTDRIANKTEQTYINSPETKLNHNYENSLHVLFIFHQAYQLGLLAM